MKLHDFVKMASWKEPISLIPQSAVNTINSICSVASYFGVSLEILRSSELPKNESATSQKNENLELKQQI